MKIHFVFKMIKLTRKLRSSILILSVISFFVFQPAIVSAQEPVKDAIPMTPQQKAMKKKKEAKEKEERKMAERDKERHINIQTKDVQKRMKKSKKEAERYNKHKRKPFYQRWFLKKNR